MSDWRFWACKLAYVAVYSVDDVLWRKVRDLGVGFDQEVREVLDKGLPLAFSEAKHGLCVAKRRGR